MAIKKEKDARYRTIVGLYKQNVKDPDLRKLIRIILMKLGINPGVCTHSERVWDGANWICPPIGARKSTNYSQTLLIPKSGCIVELLDSNGGIVSYEKEVYSIWKLISHALTVVTIKVHLEAEFNGTIVSADFELPWS